jgi:hypothetical protein
MLTLVVLPRTRFGRSYFWSITATIAAEISVNRMIEVAIFWAKVQKEKFLKLL